MRKVTDMSGRVFGRLTVLKLLGRAKWGDWFWECRCECGVIKKCLGSALRSGNTRSCGCLVIDTQRSRKTTHGGSYSETYSIWNDMRYRCLNKNHQAYHNYGGRGITVCERWLKFENFLADMGERPPGLTIDRKDNNGNYCPENCRWATRKEQANNSRHNRLITFNGKTLNMSQWANALGMSTDRLDGRINKLGWTIERALTTPAL